MSSAFMHHSPPQDEHHHADRPDLLGEWQKVYMEYRIHERLEWLESDGHEKYFLTYSRVLAVLHLQSSLPHPLDSVDLYKDKSRVVADSLNFGEDDDGVEDEGSGSLTANSSSFSVSEDMRVE
ncbi:hypothetical protein Tco_1113192 [Tanacetum coccineum]|uniref:Uncharacterized protein n=1 Tax=Tanacetum coccineum TaxID=301880 RepID=A0ABQ5IRS9_9ASTR